MNRNDLSRLCFFVDAVVRAPTSFDKIVGKVNSPSTTLAEAIETLREPAKRASLLSSRKTRLGEFMEFSVKLLADENATIAQKVLGGVLEWAVEIRLDGK